MYARGLGLLDAIVEGLVMAILGLLYILLFCTYLVLLGTVTTCQKQRRIMTRMTLCVVEALLDSTLSVCCERWKVAV